MAEAQRFLALVGSLRRDSFNRMVFASAHELLPPGSSMLEFDLRPVPFYDGDVEAETGFPPPVVALRQAVLAADGVIVFTPEYNLSIPGIVKNAIDWLSRMPGDSALTNTAIGVVAATPGGRGGLGVQGHLQDVLGRIAGRFHPTTLGIGSIGDKVENGDLTDPEARRDLEAWLVAFAAHCAAEPELDSAD